MLFGTGGGAYQFMHWALRGIVVGYSFGLCLTVRCASLCSIG